MTIARVIARLNVGGPSIQAILMTEELRRRGHRTLLLAGEVPPGEVSMEYLGDTWGVRAMKIASMSRRISWVRDVQALANVVRIFRRERPLVVHTHTAKAGALGRIAAMLARVPVRVHTFHGHVFKGYFSPAVTAAFVQVERFLARHTDCIIAISESQREELVNVYRIAPADKVRVVPVGLDLRPLLSLEGRSGFLRARIGDSVTGPLVGWIGRVTAIKNPALLVETAARLPQGRGARFIVVGEGELLSATEAGAQAAGVRSSISFVGVQKEMAAVYADLDLVLLTSRNEGTPLVLVEAMAAAKPFVATDVGGVRDLMAGTPVHVGRWAVYENGILAPADAQVLAEALSWLIQRPELGAAMGRKGREFVRTRHSFTRLAGELEAIYRDCAAAKSLLPARVAAPEPGAASDCSV